MKPPSIALIIGIGLILLGLLAFPGGARAHEQETSVDWDVAYANIQVVAAPVYTYYATQTLPLTGSGTRTVIGQIGPTGYPTIAMNTGEYLVITWSFRYVGGAAVRGDLFWITRLGLDFATIGRYIDSGTGRQWIGSSSFALVPSTVYGATLVVRSIQPNFRHLHVGVSVQNVGNIPAAPGPTGSPIPPGGPTLYGVFTDANGPVVEPLAGVTIGNSPFSGTFLLLTPWPWAVGGFVAQVVIGFAFIGFMWWYARWESRRGAKT